MIAAITGEQLGKALDSLMSRILVASLAELAETSCDQVLERLSNQTLVVLLEMPEEEVVQEAQNYDNRQASYVETFNGLMENKPE